jgi:hypothetical protein
MNTNDRDYMWTIYSKATGKAIWEHCVMLEHRAFTHATPMFCTRAAALAYVRDNLSGCEEEDATVKKVKLVDA